MASINQIDDAAVSDVHKKTVGNRGWQPNLKEKMVDQTCRVLRRLAWFRAYWLLTLEQDDISDEFKRENCLLEARLVRGNELLTLTGKHKDLGANFISRSIQNGDRCHAYFDGDRLASYGWCSSGPTRLGDYFTFTFPDEYAYMYRGFTMRDYRGARLNGHGMMEAVNLEVAEGGRGLVGLVEVQNFASLRSGYRVGFRREGIVFTFKLFGRWMTVRTPACRRMGCSLARR